MAFVTSALSAQHTLFEKIAQAINTARQSSKRQRSYRLTRNNLLALSDHQLSDLGLTRADINRAALNAAINGAH